MSAPPPPFASEQSACVPVGGARGDARASPSALQPTASAPWSAWAAGREGKLRLQQLEEHDPKRPHVCLPHGQGAGNGCLQWQGALVESAPSQSTAPVARPDGDLTGTARCSAPQICCRSGPHTSHLVAVHVPPQQLRRHVVRRAGLRAGLPEGTRRGFRQDQTRTPAPRQRRSTTWIPTRMERGRFVKRPDSAVAV